MNIELVGIRLVKERSIQYEREICSPMDAIEILANELRDMDREVCMTLNLNNRNQIINAHIISMGSLEESIVDTKSIFKAALLSNASRIMLFHNHPSGRCNPSNSDILLSKKLEQASKLLDFQFLDHIIIGKNQYYSYKEGSVHDYEQYVEKCNDSKEEIESEDEIEMDK